MTIQRTKTGPGKFTVGESGDLTTFDSQVLSITLEPDVSKDEDREVLSGEIAAGERTENWNLTGTLLNDFGQTGSLVEFCFTNRGQEKPFRFTPSTASGKEITGTIMIEALAIGGDVGVTPETDFEFALVGSPTLGAIPAP